MAILAALAGCVIPVTSLYLGTIREAGFFVLGAAACATGFALARRRTRPIPARAAEAEGPALPFLESVAEELKAALHIIAGFSEVIAQWSAREGAEWRGSCDQLVQTTRQLALFTAQLHDYARYERGALRLLEQEVDAAELLAAALDACKDEAERADAFIKADLSCSAELRCDTVRLRQAITSLILWMVEASPPASIIGVCLARTADNNLAVRIINPSSAAPPAETGSPFELQLPLKGLNSLALPIARRVALLHCGEITVETAQGAGISAVLSLPAHRVDWPGTADAMSPRAD